MAVKSPSLLGQQILIWALSPQTLRITCGETHVLKMAGYDLGKLASWFDERLIRELLMLLLDWIESAKNDSLDESIIGNFWGFSTKDDEES